jgi:hypothetical protein
MMAERIRSTNREENGVEEERNGKSRWYAAGDRQDFIATRSKILAGCPSHRRHCNEKIIYASQKQARHAKFMEV